MEGGGLGRLEIEVGEDDQEVVVVGVGLVEAAPHPGPGLVVQRPIAEARVVVGAVVLDDRDLTDISGETGVR